MFLTFFLVLGLVVIFAVAHPQGPWISAFNGPYKRSEILPPRDIGACVISDLARSVRTIEGGLRDGSSSPDAFANQ
jgi:hypothetical protein